MSPFRAVQKAIIDALVADSDVGAFVGERIFDGRPKEALFPNITLGYAQAIPDEADCLNGEEHFLQVDVWDRSQGRQGPAKDIVFAARQAIHEAELPLEEPYAMALIEVAGTEVIIDRDGITAHGILKVRALVEWSASLSV